MKLDLQTVATVFANRLGNNNSRVMEAQDESPLADFSVPGALIRVNIDQHLSVTFDITDAEEIQYTREELAALFADPAVAGIKNQFEGSAKDVVVSAPLASTLENQASANSNGIHVRVTSDRPDGVPNTTRYTLEVLLGTFSI